MAKESTNPNSTSQPDERLFTDMSDTELHSLIETEGKKFVEQTADGDIAPEDYIEAENFSLSRLMNLFFAFEYFERTDDGDTKRNYSDQYQGLYFEVYQRIAQYMGGEIYGPEYTMKL